MQDSATSTAGRALLAGLAGTAVMTGFQRSVEMPLTGRPDSYAPARLAETVLGLHPGDAAARRRLNTAVHVGFGVLWGPAYLVAARAGLRGPRAVAAVFATLYAGDLVLNTALGLYRPQDWSGQDWAVDLVDKFVLAAATGAAYERLAA